MNSLSFPVVGRFQDELQDFHIKNASIIFMDIHWYLSLPAALKLSKYLKQAHPNCQIVVGGITATLFAQQIVNNSPIDYVIRGDAEPVINRLCEAIIEGKDTSLIPNLTHKDFETRQTAVTSETQINSLQYHNFDWFPTLNERLRIIHSNTVKYSFNIPPYIMAFRGCSANCSHCCGSIPRQNEIFKRGPLHKSSAKIREELNYIDSSKRYKFVSFYHDLMRWKGSEYIDDIFNKEYNLRIYYELYKVPEPAHLEKLLQSFRGGRISVGIDQFHGTSTKLVNPDEVIEAVNLIKRYKQYEIRLTYSGVYCKSDPKYKAALEKVMKSTKCHATDASFWWFDPIDVEAGAQSRDSEFTKLSNYKGERYPLIVALARAGLHLHTLTPRLAEYFAGAMNGKIFGELL